METLLILLTIAVVAAVVLMPLLRPNAKRPSAEEELAVRLRELQALKEAKLAEIREAEMDLHSNKLSVQDHRMLDRKLRTEAAEILREQDVLKLEQESKNR